MTATLRGNAHDQVAERRSDNRTAARRWRAATGDRRTTDGQPWIAKARRTCASAAELIKSDPDSAYVLAYDAARFACVALFTQQGLRPTTTGGHYAVDLAVREQFGGPFEQFGALRRQRNELEYPSLAPDTLTPSDADTAVAITTELIDAAERMLPHLGLF